LGDDDSGKSTFLVLTYSAQIRYTAESKGDFRFYAEPEDLKVMGGEYSRMIMGDWPADSLRRRNIEFIFGYGMKGGLMGKIFGSKKFSNLKLCTYDLSANAYGRLKQDDDISSTHLTDEMSDITRCRMWVILLETAGKKKQRDMDTATLIANLTSFTRDPVYPVIFLTKYDRMRIKRLRPSQIPKVKDKKDRAAFVAEAMKVTYPKTFKFLQGSYKDRTLCSTTFENQIIFHINLPLAVDQN